MFPILRLVLSRFLASPTKVIKEFLHGPEASAVSVNLIVMEAVRQYPLVNRVNRHIDNRAGPEDTAAEIEACQRTEAHWRADAQGFVPSKWIKTWLLGFLLGVSSKSRFWSDDDGHIGSSACGSCFF